MKYMGSKNRHAKELLKIILKETPIWATYVEPFVGGGNVIDKVPRKKIGYDSNALTINALLQIRDTPTLLPKNKLEYTEKQYKIDKEKNKNGYAAFALSYGGKCWGGWCRDGLGKRDYVKEAYNNAQKQTKGLQGCILEVKQYNEIKLKKPCVIYCDPPYFNTTKYKTQFNHYKFWRWALKMANLGHTVLVSEYNAPSFCKELWSKPVNSSLTKNTGSKKAIEKLFKVIPTKKLVKPIGSVCVYCGTETEDGCCGEMHHEIGYETIENNPELILESELTEKHIIVEDV